MNRQLLALTAALAASVSMALPSSTSKMTAKHAALQGMTSPQIAPREQIVSRLIVKLRNPNAGEMVRPLAVSRMQSLSASAGVGMKSLRAMAGNASLVALDKPLPLSEAKAVAARLTLDPQVEYAEPDIMMKRLLVPTEQRYTDWQWNLRSPADAFAGIPAKPAVPTIGGANLPTAWDVTTGTAAVTIAIIDTGIVNHGDLNGNTSGSAIYAPAGRFLQGYDFISSNVGSGVPDNFVANDGDGRDGDPSDPGDWVTTAEEALYPALCDDGQSGPQNSSWHGSHMAGVAAATPNNAYGIAGVGWGVRILPVRALGKCGGSLSDIAEAIRWSAGLPVAGVPANGTPAQVLNLSLGGGSTCPQTLQDAVNAAMTAGSVVVAATGNEGSIGLIAPANCNGVIAVTAHTINGDNADYANVGQGTSISAPGGGSPTLLGAGGATDDPTWTGYYIWSSILFGNTDPNSTDGQGRTGPAFAGFTGTSAATPQASGVAGLIKTIQPTASSAFIKAWMTMRDSISSHPAGGACVGAIFDCGKGLLNAARALMAAQNLVPAVSTSTFLVVAPGTTVNLTGSAVAFPGRAITAVRWLQTSGAAVTLTGALTNTASFTAPSTGVFMFDFQATDNLTRVGADVVTVRVNSPPVLAQVPPAVTATVGQTVSFTVTATDPDGTTPIFVATAIPTGATLSATGQFTWDTTGVAAGNYALTYVASDQFSNSSPATVNITLTAASTPPGGSPPPTGGGGGGGALPFWQLLLLGALSLAARVRSGGRPQ